MAAEKLRKKVKDVLNRTVAVVVERHRVAAAGC